MFFFPTLTHHSSTSTILTAASQPCYVHFSLQLYCCCVHSTLTHRKSHCDKVLFVCLFALSITKCMTIGVQNTFQALVQKERAKLISVAIFHVFPPMIDGHYIWPRLTTDTTLRPSDWLLQKSVPAQGNCRDSSACHISHTFTTVSKHLRLAENARPLKRNPAFNRNGSMRAHACVPPCPRSFLKALGKMISPDHSQVFSFARACPR